MNAPQTLYGPWDYAATKHSGAYSDTPTYQMCAAWLGGLPLVEDWGCGTGWAKQFFRDDQYRGVDGAWSRWSDVHADLREYRSEVPGAMMRHVLEHNWEWRSILENFMASWTQRAALVLFIPPQPDDLDVGGPEWPVPDLAISGPDMDAILGDVGYDCMEVHYPPENDIQWGYEAVICMERT